jgi:hypothetical protein
MDDIYDNHVNIKNNLIANHEQNLEDIQNKLEDLRVDKNINEEQIHNLEEACNKQKNALLQELGKEKFEEHMKLLERIKLRKKTLQQKEGELNLRAKTESWSDEKLNDEIKRIRDAYQSEVKGILDATSVRQDAAHNRLMQRLMKIKGAEARNISALNAAGKASAEQITAIHAKADDEVRDLLTESGSDSDIVTDRVLHSMYDLKVQENDALMHVKENVSMSEEELASRIQAIHDRTAIASATISAQIAKNRSERNEILLKRLAARKQREAIEITGAINLATITGKPKEEVQAEIAQIKTRSEKEIDMLMKNIGMRADKKHMKLMERLANRKAKEIHNIEEIRQSAQNNGDSIESVNSKIEAVKLAAEKDTEILVKALSDRGDKQKEKQSNKVFRAINKLAEISIIGDKANEKMQNLKMHESLMEDHIKDMEKKHQSEINGLNRKLNNKKNEQQGNLQKRLAQRRQQAKKAGVSKSERQKIEIETKTIEDLAEARRLREESEDQLKQISSDFDHHQEELAKHMAIEKEQQRANLQARLRRRRSANEAKGKTNGIDTDKSARHLNALLETKKRMEQDILRRAYERMSKGGLTSEQQLKALLHDVQRVAGTSSFNRKSNQITTAKIKTPSKLAVEQGKEAVSNK